MEKGGNMKRVFERFCRGLKEVVLNGFIIPDHSCLSPLLLGTSWGNEMKLP